MPGESEAEFGRTDSRAWLEIAKNRYDLSTMKGRTSAMLDMYHVMKRGDVPGDVRKEMIKAVKAMGNKITMTWPLVSRTATVRRWLKGFRGGYFTKAKQEVKEVLGE